MDSLTALYKSLVRPHLEYCNTVWSPMYLKDSHLIESVHHRATKLIDGIKDLPYAERLSVLKLPSLKYRRLRNDMIQVYKYLHMEYNVVNDILVRDTSERTRGNSLKLVKQRFKKEIRKNYFSLRVTNIWNSLPNDILMAKNLNIFKSRLDSMWSHLHYDFD